MIFGNQNETFSLGSPGDGGNNIMRNQVVSRESRFKQNGEKARNGRMLGIFGESPGRRIQPQEEFGRCNSFIDVGMLLIWLILVQCSIKYLLWLTCLFVFHLRRGRRRCRRDKIFLQCIIFMPPEFKPGRFLWPTISIFQDKCIGFFLHT